MKTLGELRPGETGIVGAVDAVDARMKRRLMDMGITPLTQIAVRKIAPMGDPMEVHLRGYDLSIRIEDALHISLLSEEEAKAALAAEHERALLAAALSSRQPSQVVQRVVAQKRQEAMGSNTHAQSGGPVKVALVGNPNSGKTTLFNAMTGAKEYVGNWPGVTVEKKEGKMKSRVHDMMLVDLPGIYSLSPYSLDEVIARNYIIEEQPDIVINIVDGTNLERNLYLSLQLMELERPMILVLNMMDEIEKHGDQIDAGRLSAALGIPVMPISARTGRGVEALQKQCEQMAGNGDRLHIAAGLGNVYDDFTSAALEEIGEVVDAAAGRTGLPRHWAQIKVLERDRLVLEALRLTESEILAVETIRVEYEGSNSHFSSEDRIADGRYRYISRTLESVYKKSGQEGKRLSDRIDAVLTHRYLALPIFLLIMLVLFTLTFDTVGAWLSDQMGTLMGGAIKPRMEVWLGGMGVSPWLISLICDGIIGGVGGVLEFLPQIAILFLCLSFLEDSGYLTRTAFIMDKPLRRFGLSGKSFIPLLMGFGCTVPATMSARTMENEKDRRMTIILLPFMSCSAKLPVYGLIAGAFFAEYRGLVVFSLYVLGILAGIGTGILLKGTLLKGQDAPFVMEMPPYRRPTLRNTFWHVGERVLHFLERAGTVILLMSVILWFLQSFDANFQMVESAADSLLGKIGSSIAPGFAPLGFGVWQAVVALLCGLIAKEVVVSSLSLFYGFSSAAGDTAVRASLSSTFTPLSAYAFLVFVLLYVPCMAAVTTMRRELYSTKWTLFMVLYQIAVAYIAALLVFQLGTLLGLA